MKTFSITGMYVELVQMLGLMLRSGLGAQIGNQRECWDITHIKTWETDKRRPRDGASETEISEYYCGGTRKYTDHLYYARGNFQAINFGNTDGRYEKVEVRVICQLNDWHETGLSMWTLKVWVKTPNQKVHRHFFYSGRDYGGNNGMTRGEIPDDMKEMPPERIKF